MSIKKGAMFDPIEKGYHNLTNLQPITIISGFSLARALPLFPFSASLRLVPPQRHQKAGTPYAASFVTAQGHLISSCTVIVLTKGHKYRSSIKQPLLFYLTLTIHSINLKLGLLYYGIFLVAGVLPTVDFRFHPA
ncbi:hypothetical protein [Parapedobacter tibetensis]|uniref:hypothetical protein n=1 Tax=Parapedobacter tibetensis TaxID=2972951 RepID=UPI00214D8CE8|nr:hypothetical protein [Parapedobacter tibetensis]